MVRPAVSPFLSCGSSCAPFLFPVVGRRAAWSAGDPCVIRPSAVPFRLHLFVLLAIQGTEEPNALCPKTPPTLTALRRVGSVGRSTVPFARARAREESGRTQACRPPGRVSAADRTSRRRGLFSLCRRSPLGRHPRDPQRGRGRDERRCPASPRAGGRIREGGRRGGLYSVRSRSSSTQAAGPFASVVSQPLRRRLPCG